MYRLGLTDQELLNLPSRSMADRLPELPDGSIEWRYIVSTGGLVPTQQGWVLPDTASASPDRVMAWIQQNQTVVFAAAGALLLLALLGRRR